MFAGRIIAVDEDALLTWRLLGGIVADNRRTVPEPDLLLAALARHHHMTMVTRDVVHMKVTGVPLFNPWTGERFNGA